MITISRRSPLTGELNAITFPMLGQAFFDWCDMPEEFRPSLHSRFPHLSDEAIDFIYYGIMPGEWRGLYLEGKANNVKPYVINHRQEAAK
jgi:hypothetical protein